MEAKNLADLYDLPLVDWSAVVAALDAGFEQAPGGGGPNRHTCWLATLDADGSPHVAGIGAMWSDGAFWFETGGSTRKGRNIARDPRCTLSVALDDYDLVVEGSAVHVTDRDTLTRLAAMWAEGGWPAKVDDSGTALTAEFSAPSAGAPPWNLYRIEASSATALCVVEPGGATRWRW